MNKKVPLFILETFVLILVPLYQKQIAYNIWSHGRDVKNLTISQLETILLARGVYKDYVEKWEMVDQVKKTGMVANGNLEEIAASESIQGSFEISMKFKCEGSLIKQLDKKPESVWLVRILYPKQTLKMDEKGIWRNAASNLALLGMHTGVLKCCKIDQWLCAKWQDRNVGLILVAPNTTSGNHSVRYTTFPKSETAVYQWVHRQLHFLIETIGSKEFTENWLINESSKTRVAFITDSTDTPPLFFSVLSARFDGKVSFGYLPNSESSLQSLGIERFPAYLVILPSGRLHIYGSRLGEHLNYRSMELFFMTILPNFKTIFMPTCFVMNFVSALNFFSQAYGLRQNISYASINLIMLMFIQQVIWWLYTCLQLLPLPSLTMLRQVLVMATTWITLTDAAGILRQVILYWYFRYSAFFATFSSVGVGYILILRKFEAEPEQTPSQVPVNSATEIRLETNHERTTTLLQNLLTSFAEEQQVIDPAEFEYICKLPIWTWIAHAPVCSLHQDVNSTQTGFVKENQLEYCSTCSQETKSSSCAVIRITNRNYNPMPVLDEPPAGFDSSNSKCIICQCDFSFKEIVCTLPCQHTFHRNGIHQWLLDHTHNHLCPTCRECCRPASN